MEDLHNGLTLNDYCKKLLSGGGGSVSVWHIFRSCNLFISSPLCLCSNMGRF